jgi:hypothetical protein
MPRLDNKGSGGNKKLPPRRISTVGIVPNVLSTTNTTIHKHHHHGGAVCPSYDMGSMDLPNLTVVTSLEKGLGKSNLPGFSVKQ